MKEGKTEEDAGSNTQHVKPLKKDTLLNDLASVLSLRAEGIRLQQRQEKAELSAIFHPTNAPYPSFSVRPGVNR